MRFYNYVVVFLDLLGQKEHLAKFPKLVPDEGLTPDLEKTIQETYGELFKLRETIKSYFEGNGFRPELIGDLTDTQKKAIDPPKIHFQYMGDAIVLYSQLTNKYGKLNLISILDMLAGCTLVMQGQLGEGNPIRGAVEIGMAMDWEEFGIYGSAFYSAYSLESKVAKYPRIIIGEELLRYLKIWEKENGADRLTSFNRKIAKRCLSVICEDKDGLPILDFLNPNLPDIFGYQVNDVYLGHIKEGFNFVSREYKRFVNEKNSELAFRYALLREYYMNKMEAWGEKLKKQ